MTTSLLEDEPLSRWALMRSTSVRDSEVAGAKLLSSHCLRSVDRSRFDAHINGLSVGGVSLYYMKYQAALAVAAAPMRDFFAVCLPLQGGFELRQGSTRFEAYAGRSAVVVSPREPFTMEWSPDLSMFCLRIDKPALRDFAAFVDAEVDGGIAFRREVTCPHALQSLLGCVRLPELAASRLAPGQRIPGRLASRIGEQIMLTTLLAQPNTLSAKLATDTPPVGRAAIRDAVDFIEAHPAAATPSDVAAHAGLSLRALEVNFKDVLGTTPYAYILTARLRRSHDELRAADQDFGTKVTAVARRWGFTNFGRFASQYRQVYRENPSDTLKRSQSGGQSDETPDRQPQ